MLTIDPMTGRDKFTLKGFHTKSAFDYQFPDLDSPLFVVKQVVRDERGVVVGGGALKLQAETYLWLDSDLPKGVKMDVVLALGTSLAKAAWRVGLDCIAAWLPPNIPSSFAKMLQKRLGWLPTRDGWRSWVKEITT